MTAHARSAAPHLATGLRAPTPEPHRLRVALAQFRPEPGLLDGIADVGAVQMRVFAAVEAGAMDRLDDRDMRDGAAAFLSPPRPIGHDAVAGQAFLVEAARRRGRVSTNLLAAYFAGFRSDDPDVQRLARFLERDMPHWRFFSADAWRQRASAWLLLDPGNGPVRLAERMLNIADPPASVLDIAGLLDWRRTSAYAQESFLAACALTRKYRWGEALEKQLRLIAWASITGAFPYPAAFDAYALALLAPWEMVGTIGEIRAQHRNVLVEALLRHGGDPRSGAAARWSGIAATSAHRLFLGWLDRRD
ncbi:MAG: EH signature domain-containing protein [Bauldia sp.]